MEARKASVALTYNGVDAPTPNSFSYTDVASGASDSISVGMNDRDRKWIGAWFPVKGDTLQPTIRTENWEQDGKITIVAPNGIRAMADLAVAGEETVSGDVIAGGISLDNHTHTGVHGETSDPH